MNDEPSGVQKVRFASSVSTVYVLTLLFTWYTLRPIAFLSQTQPVSLTRAQQVPHQPLFKAKPIISGKPVRIVIPASNVDLPIDEGYYDDTDHSWTLSGYHAQFAMISTIANDASGDTFIYGHNNNYVFGPLRHVTPAVGAQALLYTDNGHVFAYSFETVSNLAPDDVSALQYQGPPMLTIQTCTGSIDEWRTLFKFKFDKVLQ